MEKTEKQKEVEANEMAAENNIYCENDRVVRKYYQVRIKYNSLEIRGQTSLQATASLNHEVNG